MKEKIGKILVAGAMVLASMVSFSVTSDSVYAGTCAKGVSDRNCNKICGAKNLSAEQKNAAGCGSGDCICGSEIFVCNGRPWKD